MNAAELRGSFAEAARQADLMLAIRPQISAIDPILIRPNEKDGAGNTDYTTGVWYWTITDRAAYYHKMADRVSGTTGTLVAPLPQKAAFATDDQDAGRFAGWYKSDWDASNWKNGFDRHAVLFAGLHR